MLRKIPLGWLLPWMACMPKMHGAIFGRND